MPEFTWRNEENHKSLVRIEGIPNLNLCYKFECRPSIPNLIKIRYITPDMKDADRRDTKRYGCPKKAHVMYFVQITHGAKPWSTVCGSQYSSGSKTVVPTTPSGTTQNFLGVRQKKAQVQIFNVSFPSIWKVLRLAQNKFPHPWQTHKKTLSQRIETDAHLITGGNAYENDHANQFYHLFSSFHTYGRQVISLLRS